MVGTLGSVTIDGDPTTGPRQDVLPVFEAGDEVVLRDHPHAQVFTIIELADDPVSDGGKHYFARTETGGTVFLDPVKIQAAPAEYAPSIAVGDRVRVMSDATPGTAPRGTTGTVREIEFGFVYVKLDGSSIVFPFRAKELVVLTDAPTYRKVLDFADLTALRPGAVIVNEVSGQVFVKDGTGRWLQPGWSGTYTIEAAEEIAEGLLVVYVPPVSQG
ncbi:hypothetical protein ALI22I_33745 [Saccharothrix sp. ALI-22-I]|nr:hypothetical protein ALI22I_33745 [Saccharothrix sp. ALI-22-I]